MENINLTEIKELIISTEKSKIYKSGIITDTYNKIFNKNEKPTNCGSCLRTLFLKIKNWYTEEIKKEAEQKENETIEPVTLEQVREEITIINDAIRNDIIDPDGEEAKLSNDRLVEVINKKKKATNKKNK